MMLLVILLSTFGFACSTVLPKQNTSNTVKNETGEAHWYPPPPPQPISPQLQPMYNAPSPFHPFTYGSPGYFPYTSCYPPASCSRTSPFTIDRNPSNKLMREFCRFTATASENSCNTCCKIAARHYTTSIDEVRGIMFAFDPKMPPVQTHPKPHHLSVVRKKRAAEKPTNTNPTNLPDAKTRSMVNSPLPGLIPIGGSIISSSNDIPQCFCCAPVRSVHLF
uniref:Uncharacterized protein n=1 Tax=Setaria digitata TaxID=48799 RepID=A0A915PE76_9BILA